MLKAGPFNMTSFRVGFTAPGVQPGSGIGYATPSTVVDLGVQVPGVGGDHTCSALSAFGSKPLQSWAAAANATADDKARATKLPVRARAKYICTPS